MDRRWRRAKQPDEVDTRKRQRSGALCPRCGGRLYGPDGLATHYVMPKRKKRGFLERLLDPLQQQEGRRQCDMVVAYERADGAPVLRRAGMQRAPFLPSMDPARKAAA